MTITNNAQTWEQSNLNNLSANSMVELSDADLDAVAGGTFGLLYAKVSFLKAVFNKFGKNNYGHDNKYNDNHDDGNHYGDKNKGKKY